MTNNNHYAILVTITKYPGLSDLKGPEADGKALAEWLTSPSGGNLPPDNVTHISTADFEPLRELYDAKPTEIELKKALDHLLCEDEGDDHGWKDKAGERLYLYFAGHGFTAGSSLTDPALFSAIAQNWDPAHIAGCRYAAKIASAGFFDEILLFMDCCQDILKSSQVREPTWSPPDRNRSHKVKLLQAIGAPRGKKAFERDLDNNGIARGLFTVVLLEALRTAIPDAQGWVKGYDFKKQFIQIWARRFRNETHYDPPVRLPDGDDIRILRRPQKTSSAHAASSRPDKTTIRIDLSNIGPILSPALRVHRQGNVFDGIKNFTVDTVLRTLPDLPTGLFTIKTEGNQNDFAFEVLPSEGTLQVGRIELHEVPAPSAAVSEGQRFEVTLSATDSAMQVQILDSDYNTVAAGDGSLAAELTPGVYKAELTAGGARSQEIFRVVDKPLTVAPPTPLFPAAAPVRGTSTLHKYQRDPASSLATGTALYSFPEAETELMVFVRASEPEYGTAIVRPYPWEGLFLRNFSSDGNAWRIPLEVVDKDGFFGATKLAVPAGSYSLCSPISDEHDEEEFCLALRTIPGWRTEVYIDSNLETSDETGLAGPVARPDFSRAAAHLVRINNPAMVFDGLGTHTELARIHLAEGRRSIVPSDANVKRSPMLGLYAAYAAFQQNPDDKSTIKRCLRALPAEVRTLTDVQLLEAWLHPDATSSPLQPLDIPLLTLAWDLSRRLPQEHQLAPDLRGILGQWRMGGSLWTSWRRPTQVNTACAEGTIGFLPEGSSYDTVLTAAHWSPTNAEQPVSLNPPWDMEEWCASQQVLQTLIPGHSPFQQALRRRLLDAVSLQEDVVEEQIFQLGTQYDLNRKWTALEYRSLHERIVTSNHVPPCSPSGCRY